MKQTAVEWLEEQLFELRNPTLNQIEILNQAKEMEKQVKNYQKFIKNKKFISKLRNIFQ